MVLVTGSSFIMTLLMVPVSLEQREEVVEKLKQLMTLLVYCLYCPDTLTLDVRLCLNTDANKWPPGFPALLQ